MIDLQNAGALKNFLISQFKEGKGGFEYKHNVLVFKGEDGSEYLAPKDVEAVLGDALPPKLVEVPVVAPESPKEIVEPAESFDGDKDAKPKKALRSKKK